MKIELPPNPKITIADIAEASNVSPATVSLVLRDKPGISPETRQRVLESAQNLGYIVKPISSLHVQGDLTNIGLVIKTRLNDLPQTNNFYSPVLIGIETICRQRQINLLYATMLVDEENQPLELPRLITDQQVDGLLLVGILLNEAVLSLLQRQSVPVVLADAYANGDPYDMVVSDNFNGAYKAVTYLIGQGHQHIGIVGSQQNSYPSIQERRLGYVQAMRDHHLSPYFGDSSLDSEKTGAVVLELLHQHPEITAIFGCNDEVAIAVIKAAHEMGRNIPQDLAVIGFDNIALAQYITPSLTTMQVDKIGMGRLATQLLINRIEYPEADKVKVVIRPHLIERQSVGSVENKK